MKTNNVDKWFGQIASEALTETLGNKSKDPYNGSKKLWKNISSGRLPAYLFECSTCGKVYNRHYVTPLERPNGVICEYCDENEGRMVS